MEAQQAPVPPIIQPQVQFIPQPPAGVPHQAPVSPIIQPQAIIASQPPVGVPHNVPSFIPPIAILPLDDDQSIAPELTSELHLIRVDLYTAINCISHIPTIQPLPFTDTSDSVFKYIPLDINGNSIEQHFSSTLSLSLIAQRTFAKSLELSRTYAARCFNTYLTKRNLISKISLVEPLLSSNQIIYSLTARFFQFKNLFLNENAYIVNQELQSIQMYVKEARRFMIYSASYNWVKLLSKRN